MPKNPTMKSDDAQAAYWGAPVSRLEVQKVIDQQSETIKVLTAQVGAGTLAMAYLFAKLQVQQPEFDAFIRARAAQITAEQSQVKPN